MIDPLISICIPAYSKPDYVVRLLESVIQQTYKRVEVVISDDSPDDSVKIAIEPYKSKLSIVYMQNRPALKSPANWNNAIKHSKGDFFVLLHQDDWLHDFEAFNKYLKAFRENPKAGFIFCKNTAVTEDGKEILLQHIPNLLYRLTKTPLHLLLAQVIGPPSNTLLRAEVKDKVQYDEDYIWLVDVDYYVRVLQAGFDYVYLDEHLVSIGLHEDQTTVFCRNNENIIIKENINFAIKKGTDIFSDLLIYDYYWRFLRNYSIRKMADLVRMGVTEQEVPNVIKRMLDRQLFFTLNTLRIGMISKILMFISYLMRPHN